MVKVFSTAKSVLLMLGPQQIVRAVASVPDAVGTKQHWDAMVVGAFSVKLVRIEEIVRRSIAVSCVWNGADLIRLSGQFEVEAVHQLVVRERCDADGESGLEGRDAGERPAVQSFGPRNRCVCGKEVPSSS